MTQQFQPSFADRTDYENTSRGFIGSLDPCIIRGANGKVVYNNESYAFLRDTEAPATCNPKLWRQGQLASTHGLFEVTSGIYQVRGLDLASMTIVEGEKGVLVIDPLTSAECAAAALDLYKTHRGDKPVTGVIYSHSHIDHFGGAEGVLPLDTPVAILAPEGFMEEATSENIYVGPAMSRRAMYMYGIQLPRSPKGQVGCGIGMAVSTGTSSLVPPNDLITQTGQERTIDGIRIEFQLVPGTEAPAEMNFYFPAHRALYIAECATHCLHNILTLRGALVRDAKAWARHLDESLVLYGERSDVVFAGHNWPTWGRNEVVQLISEQRDLYGYLHDQTVRMMNLGMTGIEIAETIVLPQTLQKAWHTQGFYGSVSHNVKAIYQRYMGWFDGNPAHLWEHPPLENARRYVACMGGIGEVIRKAEDFAKDGDLRFAATLLGHAVALDPRHEQSRTTLATVFERLGYGAENSTWRNFYLSAAQDLRQEKNNAPPTTGKQQFNMNQSVEQWWGLLSVRLNGLKAENKAFIIDIHVTDEKEWRLIVSNGMLSYRTGSNRNFSQKVDLVLSVSKDQLRGILDGVLDFSDLDYEGNESFLYELLSMTKLETRGGDSLMK